MTKDTVEDLLAKGNAEARSLASESNYQI